MTITYGPKLREPFVPLPDLLARAIYLRSLLQELLDVVGCYILIAICKASRFSLVNIGTTSQHKNNDQGARCRRGLVWRTNRYWFIPTTFIHVYDGMVCCFVLLSYPPVFRCFFPYHANATPCYVIPLSVCPVCLSCQSIGKWCKHGCVSLARVDGLQEHGDAIPPSGKPSPSRRQC